MKTVLLLVSQFLITGCAAVLPISVATTSVVLSDQRSVGHMIDDKLIASKIKTELSKYSNANMFLSVGVTVLEGRVLLTGSVISQSCIDEAIKIAWSIKGVREVMNELVVELKHIQDSANDTLIESAVNSKLLLEKNLMSTNYKVSVNNGNVFILGIAQSENEREKALEIAKIVKGVKRVVSYIILKNDPRRG